MSKKVSKCLPKFVCLLLLINYASIRLAASEVVNVTCDSKSFQQKYSNLFNLIISKKDSKDHLVQIEHGQNAIILDNTGRIKSAGGRIEKREGTLIAVLDINCELLSSIECELYGKVHGLGEFEILRFQPHFTFGAATKSPEMSWKPRKDIFSVEDVLLVNCTGSVGERNNQWRWSVKRTQQRATTNTFFHPVPLEDFTVSNTTLSKCSHTSTSRYAYTFDSVGDYVFTCEIDGRQATSARITVMEDHSEYFSRHLFISSFLVYVHFIVLPFIFGLFGDHLKYRKPEQANMRRVRTCLSYLIAILFIIWWAIVIATSSAYEISFIWFAVIEFVFLFFYATVRLSATLSECFEKKRQRYLYNARVAASWGAVLTPALCFIMMKCYGCASNKVLEIFFWIFTLLSVMVFVCISKTREEKYWEIRGQSLDN